MKARRKAWITGEDRRPLSPYLHLVRAPDDPERMDRARSLGGTTKGDAKILSYHKLRKRPLPELAAEIVDLLSDNEPRTFNRIAVELWDKTADVVFEEAPDHALWSLVLEGRVEYTIRGPIFFRMKKDREIT